MCKLDLESSFESFLECGSSASMSLTRCRMRIVTPRDGKIRTRCLFRGTAAAAAAATPLLTAEPGLAASPSSALRLPFEAAL